MQTADRIRLPEPERPGLGRVGLAPLVVDLGHGQDHRPLGPAQGLGHHQVGLGRAGARVDDEQHQIGGGHRLLGLPRHHGLQSGCVRLPAAGVDQGEPPAVPFGVVGDPVPGHPRHVLHHRLPPAQDAVDQGRLADVGPPDHGHDRGDGDVVGVAIRPRGRSCAPLWFARTADRRRQVGRVGGHQLGHRLPDQLGGGQPAAAVDRRRPAPGSGAVARSGRSPTGRARPPPMKPTGGSSRSRRPIMLPAPSTATGITGAPVLHREVADAGPDPSRPARCLGCPPGTCPGRRPHPAAPGVPNRRRVDLVPADRQLAGRPQDRRRPARGRFEGLGLDQERHRPPEQPEQQRAVQERVWLTARITGPVSGTPIRPVTSIRPSSRLIATADCRRRSPGEPSTRWQPGPALKSSANRTHVGESG